MGKCNLIRGLSIVFAAFAVVVASAETEGWDNINPGRKEFPVQKLLWKGDFSAAKLKLRDGAKGFIKVVNMKTGKTVKNGTLLELDMTAGETRWYRLLD